MSFSGIPEIPQDMSVQNDGWFPDLSVSEFQNIYRLPADYHADLIADHLKLAMAWANRQLADWKADREAEGVTGLAEHPGLRLGGEPVVCLHYRRAVFAEAKALLLRQFATVNRRAAAENEAKEGEETEDRFHQYAELALADLIGRPRVTVALI